MQPGGRGGWIFNGNAMLETRFDAPDDWYNYLLDKYGPGEYHVTTQGPRGRIMTLFSQPVGTGGELGG